MNHIKVNTNLVVCVWQPSESDVHVMNAMFVRQGAVVLSGGTAEVQAGREPAEPPEQHGRAAAAPD